MNVTYATVLNGNILLEGVVIAEVPNPPNPKIERYKFPGYFISKVVIYKPGERRWLNVNIDTLGFEFGTSDFSVQGNICYLVRKGEDRRPAKVNRVICDFDGDNPTMVLAETVNDKTLDLYERSYDSVKYTFDKRKVGFQLVDCYCVSHKEKKSQQMMQD